MIDPAAEFIAIGDGPAGADLVEDAGEQTGILGAPEVRGILLGDQRVVGKRLGQGPTDERLTAEVGDGHGAEVGLGERRGIDLATDGAAEVGGESDGIDGGGALAFIRSHEFLISKSGTAARLRRG